MELRTRRELLASLASAAASTLLDFGEIQGFPYRIDELPEPPGARRARGADRGRADRRRSGSLQSVLGAGVVTINGRERGDWSLKR